jgi:acyl-homoserine lactone synthase
MFEARKRVFVDLLGWDVPVVGGRFEIDAFDDEHATYLIVCDASGGHLGSARLLKTVRPHILSSLFPSLCEGPPPADATTLEITRFCLARGQAAPHRRWIRNRLVTALVEHALASGTQTYTGVAEMGWLQQILSFGWRCRMLGMPRPHGRTMLGALRIDIDENTPFQLVANGVWAASPQGAAARSRIAA